MKRQLIYLVLALSLGLSLVMAVPVMGRGEVLGVLEVVNKGAEGLFVEDDQTLMSLMSCFVGELLYRMSEKETEHRPRDAEDRAPIAHAHPAPGQRRVGRTGRT